MAKQRNKRARASGGGVTPPPTTIYGLTWLFGVEFYRRWGRLGLLSYCVLLVIGGGVAYGSYRVLTRADGSGSAANAATHVTNNEGQVVALGSGNQFAGDVEISQNIDSATVANIREEFREFRREVLGSIEDNRDPKNDVILQLVERKIKASEGRNDPELDRFADQLQQLITKYKEAGMSDDANVEQARRALKEARLISFRNASSQTVTLYIARAASQSSATSLKLKPNQVTQVDISSDTYDLRIVPADQPDTSFRFDGIRLLEGLTYALN